MKGLRRLGMLVWVVLWVLSLGVVRGNSQEMVIGEERVEPGIIFIFEGAVKDTVMPRTMHLMEKETHIHIEARVNWDEKNIPEGTPAGGFVPYLKVVAKIQNQRTKQKSFVDLLPHINLIDNFHYARNVHLPGRATDKYNVTFYVMRPGVADLSIHKDWMEMYGRALMKKRAIRFMYKGLDFEEIVKASR